MAGVRLHRLGSRLLGSAVAGVSLRAANLQSVVIAPDQARPDPALQAAVPVTLLFGWQAGNKCRIAAEIPAHDLTQRLGPECALRIRLTGGRLLGSSLESA